MNNNDWKAVLGQAFDIDPNASEQVINEEQSRCLTPQEQQEKQMIDIILDKKGRNGKKATIVANLKLDDEALKTLAAELKRCCSVGGSARGGEILIQGDMREKVKAYLVSQGYKARII